MDTLQITDELWDQIRVVLPPVRTLGSRRRKVISDRSVLNGLLYVLQQGIAFDELPKNLGYGSGMTVWKRLEEWKRGDTWTKIQSILTANWPAAKALDWSRIEKLNTRGRNKSR